MTPVTFQRFSFGSFFKLSTFVAASSGIGFGVLFFLLALLGNATWNGAVVTSIEGKVVVGAVGLVITPIISIIFGAVIAVIAYLPSRWVLRITKGITVEQTQTV
jgi:hypothetical protein